MNTENLKLKTEKFPSGGDFSTPPAAPVEMTKKDSKREVSSRSVYSISHIITGDSDYGA